METKFIDYMNFCIAHDLEFDAIIGGVDMPATFCFYNKMKFTDYCKERYGDLLNSKCKVTSDPKGRYTDVVEVFYDDETVGEQFTWAIAGYIPENEYDALFGINE